MLPNGYTFYDGPSELDGKPILGIITGYRIDSANRKTVGAPLQTWILPRNIQPLEATRTGADVSICGDCPHRGRIENGHNSGRSCYVEVHFGVRNVWLAWERGNYPEKTRPIDLADLGHDRTVRLGSYGDPAAIPVSIWRCLTFSSTWVMGYTQQWAAFPKLRRWCMASVHNPDQRAAARALGWRTFRVRREDEPLGEYEIACPASAEAGHKSSCEDCRACSGLAGKAKCDIAIVAHGAIGRIGNFNRRSFAGDRISKEVA